jgi:hypothetical protein
MNSVIKVLKWQDYSKSIDLAQDFLENIKISLLESKSDKEENDIVKYLEKVKADLSLNFAFASTFGTGVGFALPIVKELIENGNIQVESSSENLILLTITCFSIMYLEIKKGQLEPLQVDLLRKDSKSLLTELKLKGIGGGIVKKVIQVFEVISQIFNYIFKAFGLVVQGFLDIFAYTSILVPFMNGVKHIVGKYDLTVDNFVGNFTSLGIGVTSLVAKHGINYIKSKLKKNLGKDFDGLDTTKSSQNEVEIIQDKFF